MALPFDALFLGSFAYAGYRTLGRWLKFNDDNAKHKRGARAPLTRGGQAGRCGWALRAPLFAWPG